MLFMCFLVLIQAFSGSFPKFFKNMTISLHFATYSTFFFFFPQQKCLWRIFEGGSVVSDVTENFRDLERELGYCDNQFCAKSQILCTCLVLTVKPKV